LGRYKSADVIAFFVLGSELPLNHPQNNQPFLFPFIVSTYYKSDTESLRLGQFEKPYWYKVLHVCGKDIL
jgi:hypothetical protein